MLANIVLTYSCEEKTVQHVGVEHNEQRQLSGMFTITSEHFNGFKRHCLWKKNMIIENFNTFELILKKCEK